MSSWIGKNTAKAILRETRAMTERMNKLPIKGRKTSGQTQKQIEKMRSDMQFNIARKCNVLVTFPKLHIVGNKVVLGDPHIWLPNCRIVSFETLIAIEEGREEAY
jgi:hypothetical protein